MKKNWPRNSTSKIRPVMTSYFTGEKIGQYDVTETLFLGMTPGKVVFEAAVTS